MVNNLKLAVIQTDLHWEDKSKNIKMFNDLLNNIDSDVIILPEMFNTGFSMRPEILSESMSDDSVKWMIKKSSELNSAICGSLIISDSGKYYNRFVWIEPNGRVVTYDKRHLFGFADEDKHYTSGQQRVIIEYKGWKILPLICYDLRFPVWSRNNDDYDLMIYVANWPQARRNAWRTLLQARSIENQSFVVGVNRIGDDGSGKPHSGDSMIIDPLGDILFDAQNKNIIHTETIEINKLYSYRQKFPFLKDKDKFKIL
jgi:predicted amidohydrolase